MNRSVIFSAVAAGIPAALLAGAAWLWLPSGELQPAKHPEAAKPLPPAPPPIAVEPASLARSLAKICARMENNPAALLKADEELDLLTPEQLRAACEEAAKLPKETKETVLRLLCIRWAEIDPQAAMMWGSTKGPEYGRVMNDIGHTWARRDVKGLLAWYEALPDKKALRDFIKAVPVADWVAGADVGDAARALCAGTIRADTGLGGRSWQFFDPARRPISFTGTIELTARVHTKEDIAKLIAVAEEFPYEPARRSEREGRVVYSITPDPRREVAAIIENVCPKIDPAGWLEWIKEHPVSTSGRDHALGMALDNLSTSSSPAAEAERIAAATWHEPREDVLAQVVATWAAQDVNAAGTWLRTQGTRGDVWPAIEGFAGVAIKDDPGAAFAWLEHLPDAARREEFIIRTYEQWHKKKPNEASAWLQSSGWPDDRMQSVAEMIISRPVPFR